MANRRFIDFPIASTVGDNDIVLIWQDGANKQTTKATILSGLPENLEDLNDVVISGLTNGQILRYDSVTGKWENTDQGNLDLNDLNDVSIVSPSNGQVLVYNSSTSKWENSSGGFVPYTGAVTTVNLGAQTIQAGQFVKAGGTSSQFLKADGSIDSTAYGTGSVTSVGLTMPSAFNVANSPITSAGTLAVTGAGTVGQYIRGDGSLADFPQTSGGGSSVSYYLNGSVNQGTIGGVAYLELSKIPILGAGTDFSINADGYIASFITDAGDPNLLEIPGGNWNFETYFSASSGGGSPTFYVELYKVNAGGTATLIASSSSVPELIAFGTNLTPYFSTLAVPNTTLALTDRLALRYYVNNSGRTITMHTENNHLCQIITTFTTGLTALNGLTAQVQNFAVGTSGSDFNIASATATHTFNLPTASATNRGALSSADWTTFNNKENAITAGTTAQYFRGDKTFQTLNTSVVPELTNLYYTDARVNANANVAANTAARHNAVTLGTANGLSLSTQVLSLGLASAGVTGALSGTDWSTFNNKASTAQLANYLPLAGGTLTGQLNGTIISLSGDITANKYRGVNSLVLNTYTTVNPSSNVYLYSPGNDRDAWIYLDSADTGSNWGIYHRQIDSPVAGLPGNSIGFIGGGANTLQSYINILNGDAYFKGNVGIGTTNQTSIGGYIIQTINGTSGSFTEYQENATNIFRVGSDIGLGGFLFTQGSLGIRFGTASSERMRITSSGNLLVGTTTDNGARLQVSGAITFTGIGTFNNGTNSTNGIKIISTLTSSLFTGGLEFIRTTVSGGSKIEPLRDATIGGVGLSFQVTANNTAEVNATYTSAMNILNNGNVGIGTASPSGAAGLALAINGGASQTRIALKNSFTGDAAGDGFQILLDSGGADVALENREPGSMRFATDSTERMRITSSGNVGIGTSSSEAAISGTERVLQIANSNVASVYLNCTSANNYALFSSASGNFTIYNTTAGASRLSITSGGNVLIGTTTSGGAKLEVVGDTYLRNQVFTDTIRPYSGDKLQLLNGGSNFLHINGNVGIGTSSPVVNLHVDGGKGLVRTTNSGWGQFSVANPNDAEVGITWAAGGTGYPGVTSTYTRQWIAGLSPFGTGTDRWSLTNNLLGSNTAITVRDIGSVGIGTTNPSTRLSLGTGVGPKFMVYDNASNVYAGMGQDLAAGNSTDIFAHGAGGGFITFGNLGTNKTTYTEWVRINTTGNVLIGSTTDNGTKLQVNGAIRTAQPVGTTSNGWLLGRALISGTSTPNRWIRVQIGLEYYDILAVYMGTL